MNHLSVEASVRVSPAGTSTSFKTAGPKFTSVKLQSKSFLGGSQQLTLNKKAVSAKAYSPLQVEALVSKETKEETVAKLKENLEKTFLLASFTYQGLSVAEVKAFRRSLPEDCEFIVSKNTLMKIAVQGTEFEEFGNDLKGPNGFLMVGEDGIKEAMKACDKLSSAMKKEKREQDIALQKGIMDGTMFDQKQLKQLESMPSKQELITKIAVGIKAVPTKVALSIKAVPRKVGYAANALKDKLDEEA